jgi:hypothetical protein
LLTSPDTGARLRIAEDAPEVTLRLLPLLSVTVEAIASIVGSEKMGRFPLCKANSMALSSAVTGLARVLALPLYHEAPGDAAFAL